MSIVKSFVPAGHKAFLLETDVDKINKTMIEFLRTTSANADFKMLVQALDAYLAEIDGKEHEFYAQFNSIALLQHVIVAYQNKKPLACGAIKLLEPGVMEVKRMYTLPEARGKGLASAILGALESWALELGCHTCRLETGKRMPDAVALYLNRGYRMIDNYGQYVGVNNSICFEKTLTKNASAAAGNPG